MKIDSDPEPDLFDKADSSAAIMAYIHATMGEDGLKALFNLTDKKTLLYLIDRESLERDAAELGAVGLPDVAAIVREAAQMPGAEPRDYSSPRDEKLLICPFPETDQTNWRNWHLNTRPNSPVPFQTIEAAEECLQKAGYEPDDDGFWRNQFGKVESAIAPTQGGFRISKRLADGG
jgi:hypothetical protein